MGVFLRLKNLISLNEVGSAFFLFLFMYLPSLVLADPRIFVNPPVVNPDADGLVRFSIDVEEVPDPGFGSYALTVAFDSPIISLNDETTIARAGLDGIVTCSSVLADSDPAAQDFLGVAVTLKSAQGSFLQDSLGSGGEVLCTKNGSTLDNDQNVLPDKTRSYNCGVPGTPDQVAPVIGHGALIDFS